MLTSVYNNHNLIFESAQLALKMDVSGRDYVKERMPMIGVGTYQIHDQNTLYTVLDTALTTGYRMIDTAQLYGTEESIGEILSELLPKHKLKREDIFLSSKLTPLSHGTELAEEAIEQCLDDLQTDYLDLLLIHWPGVCKMPGIYPHNPSLRMESYKTMEKYYKRGDLRAIGVSNFEERHLNLLLEGARVLPAVNQVEYHPHWHQNDLRQFCEQKGIMIQAYSSLGNSEYKDELWADRDVVRLAQKYKVPIPTFLLSWSISQGISVLPRSSNPDHIRRNFDAINTKIDKEDIDSLLNNNIAKKVCWDSSYIL